MTRTNGPAPDSPPAPSKQDDDDDPFAHLLIVSGPILPRCSPIFTAKQHHLCAMAAASPSESFTPSSVQGSHVVPMMAPNEKNVSRIPPILPRERVFPIQIGSELFKLSGASLSSDAPSYFSQYFLCQIKQAEEHGEDVAGAIRTLYIDRDPVTFRDIALHLQGYHVMPRDGKHFVRLFADAQFYSLPKLISRLYEESIFISIGHREFQIPRDLLTDPRNSPNYFSLGFAFFFSRPDNLFPGLDREGLIRPPSILPPSVPNRNADTFADLLRLLRGYPVNIRDETHRRELLRDARYFHFKGLEQQLLPHSIAYNSIRGHDEITLRLENVQKSGLGILQDRQADDHGDDRGLDASVVYARPYIDDKPAELVLEMANESSRIHFLRDGPRLELFRDTKARVAKLLEVIAAKLNLPPTTQPLGLPMASGGASSQAATPGNTPLSEDLVRAVLGPDAAVTLDGEDLDAGSSGGGVPQDANAGVDANGDEAAPRKRKRTADARVKSEESWAVARGQWRLRIQATDGGKSAAECVFVAVRLDCFSDERGRNFRNKFLAS
ncbi:BTB/POZ domain-containing protein [Metarhizium album ARSEF 1941]|uniref:BTB/POZ domain-containing protein n=1 Tax=Metarhizium album (strain ARSEF 1941) TaxID=1081103 RepID=A0A0B2X7Y0_METAS|nr:BTB/POZ domain-containing protein [Metarhizium album ARSEF 1941]KHO01858.1 BTB/POZ domain-containing protein [Metarhizium album ARSEF 1941]